MIRNLCLIFCKNANIIAYAFRANKIELPEGDFLQLMNNKTILHNLELYDMSMRRKYNLLAMGRITPKKVIHSAYSNFICKKS